MGKKRLSYEERKLRKLESAAKWRAENPDYHAKWREENPDYDTKWRETPIGRASNLVNRYLQSDIKYNRGECTLTAQWVMDNIFSKPCHYCGETDWLKIGCDRIDNSKPHTPDNVVPCCAECNRKRGRKSYEEFTEMLKVC